MRTLAPGSVLELLTANLGAARRVYEAGREYLVAPLTSIVPGVLNGSKGKLFYPLDEIQANFRDWDEIPLTLRHPTDPLTNEHLSADTDGVWDRQGLGFIRDSAVRGKLQHNAWFDVERTTNFDRDLPEGQRIIPRLLRGQPIEVSTGLYTDNEQAPAGANYRGRPYDFTARNYRPDHMAVLPDMVGACSVRDGCGVLVNVGKKRVAVNDEQPSEDISPEKSCQILHDKSVRGHPLTDAQRGMFGAALKGQKCVKGVLNQDGDSEQSGPSKVRRGAGAKADPAILREAAENHMSHHEEDDDFEDDDLEENFNPSPEAPEMDEKQLEKAQAGGKTWNAGPNQPRHLGSGQYLPHGAGTGRGPAHEAATDGYGDRGYEEEQEDGEEEEDGDEEEGEEPEENCNNAAQSYRDPTAQQRSGYPGDTPNPPGFDGRQTRKVTRQAPIDTVDGDGDPEEDADSHDPREYDEYADKIQQSVTNRMASMSDDEVFAVYNRDWPQEKRDQLPAKDFAGPGRSFPISTQEDVHAAVRSIGRSKHDPEVIKAGIKRVAEKKGLSLPESWQEEGTENDNPEGHNQYTFSRQASASSDVKADKASKRAEKADDSGDHVRAAVAHRDAFRAHQDAAAQSSIAFQSDREAYHRGKAQEHKEQAARHAKAAGSSAEFYGVGNQTFGNYRETQMDQAQRQRREDMEDEDGASCNSFAANDGGFDSDEQRHAFFGHLAKEKGDSPEGKASARANSTGKSEHHAAAARLHRAAARSAREEGNDSDAQIHTQAARFHSYRANKTKAGRSGFFANSRRGAMPTIQQIRNDLTDNCACDQDRRAINTLSDETLRILFNAKAEGSNADASGGMGFGSAVQAGGEEDQDDEDQGVKDDMGAGKKGVFFESKKGKGLEGSGVTKGPADNAVVNHMAIARMFGITPDQARNLPAIVRDSLRHQDTIKRDLAMQLTANVLDPGKRKILVNRYVKELSKEKLQEYASLVQGPPVRQMAPAFNGVQEENLALYLGAAGGPTGVANFGNGDGGEADSDVLDLPTMNYGTPQAGENRSPQWDAYLKQARTG
jgi:hypothetical protein